MTEKPIDGYWIYVANPLDLNSKPPRPKRRGIKNPEDGCTRREAQYRLRVSRPTMAKWIGWLKAYRNEEFRWRDYHNRRISNNQLRLLRAVKKLATTRTDEQVLDLLQDKEFQLL